MFSILKAPFLNCRNAFSSTLSGSVVAVIHAASRGMSSTENLPAFDDETEVVNLDGTRNLLKEMNHEKMEKQRDRERH